MKRLFDLLRAFRETPIVDDDFPEVRDKFDKAWTYLAERIPTIVCLCGSTRFFDRFMEANYLLTMEGKIVLSVGFYPHAEKKVHHSENVGCTPEEKVKLDDLHKRKIDLCDEVFVLNEGGYIGDSTRSEIQYALEHGKRVYYMEPAPDNPIYLKGMRVHGAGQNKI